MSAIDNAVEGITTLCNEQPFNTHWYLKDLETGEEANGAGDIVIPSASTRKISILMAALKKVNDGAVSLDDPFVIEERFQKSGSGCFTHLKPGFEITFFDALVMMIIVSDNACTGKIVEIIDIESVDDFCHGIGMESTSHRSGWGSAVSAGLPWDHPVEANNATTANDLGVLLNLMVEGMTDDGAAAKLGCTTDLVNLGMEIMTWQKMRQRLPYMLPMGTTVAHKTGTGVRNYNDAGVVYADGKPRYVMVGLTDQVPRVLPNGLPGSGVGSLHVGQICRAAWDGLVG